MAIQRGAALLFVSLADLADSWLLAEAIAEAIEAPHDPSVPPMNRVERALSRGPALLILDNFEQLLDVPTPTHVTGGALPDGLSSEASRPDSRALAVDCVTTLLRRVPGLTCLVTSRRRLGVPGEHELPLGPLSVPSCVTAPEELMRVESVQLFVDRAQHVRPDFALTPNNAAAVAELCERLDGLPLAIELAAAWAQTLTPAQLLEKLSDRFRLLINRNRPEAPRHRSLYEVLEWSWCLLPPELRQFFARLGVFRGGWSLEAVEEVCGEPCALEYLTELRDRSLLQAEEREGEMRYRLLECVREYAQGQLEHNERQLLAERHALYYIEMAEKARASFRTINAAPNLDQMRGEYSNLQAALERHIGDEQGLRLAGALAPYWLSRGPYHEASGWLEQVLTANPEAPRSLKVLPLAGSAAIALLRGERLQGRTRYLEALAQLHEIEDSPTIAAVLDVLTHPFLIRGMAESADILPDLRDAGERIGYVATQAFSLSCDALLANRAGETGRARCLQRESVALFQELKDPVAVTESLRQGAEFAVYQGDFRAARGLLDECLAVYRELGTQKAVAGVLSEIGYVAGLQGDTRTAREMIEQQLQAYRETGDRAEIAGSLWLLGNVERFQGNYCRAEELLQESLAMRRQGLGGVSDTLDSLAMLALCRGDIATARAAGEVALSLRRESGDKLDTSLSLSRLASIALLDGRLDEAEMLSSEAIETSCAIESRAGLSIAKCVRGQIALARNELEEAVEFLVQSLTLAADGCGARYLLDPVEALAEVRTMQGLAADAAMLFGASSAARADMGAPLPPFQRQSRRRSLSKLRAMLDAEALRIAWSAGKRLTLEEAAARVMAASATVSDPQCRGGIVAPFR